MKGLCYLYYGMVGLLVVGLSACSTNPAKTASLKAYRGASGGEEAKSYALLNNPEYTEGAERSGKGKIKNSMKAPSNQTYYFAFDSNQVSSGDDAYLVAQAAYLVTHPKAKIRLEGNTDNRGSREYNVGLGWRRDQSVERILEQHGVLPSQMNMVSYGKEHPASLGDNEYAWGLNRRVNLVYEAY